MITDFEPTYENVCSILLGACPHTSLIGGFCADCESHPNEIHLKDLEDLKKSLTDPAGSVSGGYFIGEILAFITKYADLVLSKDGDFRHGFCMGVTRKDKTRFYYTRSRFSFAYEVCWLAEILMRILSAEEGLNRRSIYG